MIFFFGISVFVLEIFRFLYSEERDEVIGSSSKTVQHSIKSFSGNIKALFF